MQIIKPLAQLMLHMQPSEILDGIEEIARVCYKSQISIHEDAQNRFIKKIINSGHESVLEHISFSVKFIVDRGVSHEIVRHRIASYTQESTRYCNYSKDKFGNEITVIKPCFFEEGSVDYESWKYACKTAEQVYMLMIDSGVKPEEARCVLPNSLKTELVMTANVREWRHFLKLRAKGISGKPHPQMLEVTSQLLDDLHKTIPILFDDIHTV